MIIEFLTTPVPVDTWVLLLCTILYVAVEVVRGIERDLTRKRDAMVLRLLKELDDFFKTTRRKP